jgi:hypothetical protein
LVGDDTINYACKLTSPSTVEGITFRNAGATPATVSCGLLIIPDASSTIMRHCTFAGNNGGGAQKVDLVAMGAAGTLFVQQCNLSFLGGNSFRNVGSAVVILQNALLLGASLKDTGAGAVIHSMTATITGMAHVSKGYYINHAGVMFYMDGTNPATSVDALLDIVIALP